MYFAVKFTSSGTRKITRKISSYYTVIHPSIIHSKWSLINWYELTQNLSVVIEAHHSTEVIHSPKYSEEQPGWTMASEALDPTRGPTSKRRTRKERHC